MSCILFRTLDRESHRHSRGIVQGEKAFLIRYLLNSADTLIGNKKVFSGETVLGPLTEFLHCTSVAVGLRSGSTPPGSLTHQVA
jgi:hypothetical protein